jgi:uncharacterized protein
MAVVALLVVGYLGVCGYLYANQRQLIYHPQATRVAAADTNFLVSHGGVTLRGWVINPGRPKAILYFGGNAERIEGNRESFAHWFPDSTVYLLAYRGFGASDGAPDEQALGADALALYDQVHAEHPDAPIAVIGRSLGSGVASYLASQRPVARLALITPFDSIADTAQAHFAWLPARLLVKDRYDSVAHLASYHGPVLVVRAGQDDVIPARNSARLIASLTPAPTVVDLPEAGHNTLDEYPQYGEALAAFMR